MSGLLNHRVEKTWTGRLTVSQNLLNHGFGTRTGRMTLCRLLLNHVTACGPAGRVNEPTQPHTVGDTADRQADFLSEPTQPRSRNADRQAGLGPDYSTAKRDTDRQAAFRRFLLNRGPGGGEIETLCNS